MSRRRKQRICTNVPRQLEMSNEHHNEKCIRGNRKGQFIKSSVKNKWEKAVKARNSENDNSPEVREVHVEVERDNVTEEEKESPKLPKIIEIKTALGESKYVMRGRRVIDVELLAENLWCTECDIPLSLRFVLSEKRAGLASILNVQCKNCCAIYHVCTSNKTESKHYHVNMLLAIGMYDAGMGEAHVNTLLSELDVPVVSPTTLKHYERVVGPAIEAIADQSCEEALIEEIALSSDKEVDDKSDDEASESTTSHTEKDPEISPRELRRKKPKPKKHKLIGGLDTGWQRRGTGRSYNSSSGHTSMRARKTGKMIGRAGRTKKCAKCARGNDPSNHDCRFNYTNSSKSMEADMAKELVLNNPLLNKYDALISVLIMDDDSSTICALRREATDIIEKWSDINHAKKNLTKKLILLKMPQKVQDYFTNCFSIAIKQNEGNADGVRAALLSIVPHAFGEHAQCGDWCKFAERGSDYEHEYLPHGKPLTDENLRIKLSEIFSKVAKEAEKLAPCGSTQGNESFNNVVASKHPKNRHYAGSESFFVRVAAAVCQWNLGTIYVAYVNLKLGLPIGHFTLHSRGRKDIKRKRKAVEASSVEKKRRRIELKKKRSNKDSTAERKEGVTYESDCCIDTLPQLLGNELRSADEDLSNASMIMFDLETTGLGKNAEITQIAACCADDEFNAYVLPSRGIPQRVSELTGLRVVGGEMYSGDTLLETASLKVALENFLMFLEQQGDKIILVAHNGFRFDFPIILRTFKRYNLLEEFQKIVNGLSDTLNIFRDSLPERKKAKKKFSQTSLAVDYLGPESLDGAHNALVDVHMLQKLIVAIGVNVPTILKHTQSIQNFLRSEALKDSHSANKSSLDFLKDSISSSMLSKIAKAGINRRLFIEVYTTKGPKGIEMILSEDVRGRPRVTKHAKSIAAIVKIISTSAKI